MNTAPDFENRRTAAETFRAWLAEINAALGTEFAFDASGLAGIEFESGDWLRMQIVEEDCLYLYAPLFELEGEPTASFLLSALALNVYDTTEMGGSLGYDAEIHALVYTERLRKTFASPYELAMRIDAFPATLQRLRKALAELKQHSEAAESSPESLDSRVQLIQV